SSSRLTNGFSWRISWLRARAMTSVATEVVGTVFPSLADWGALPSEASPPAPLPSPTRTPRRERGDSCGRIAVGCAGRTVTDVEGAHSAPYKLHLLSQVPPLPPGEGPGVRLRRVYRRAATPPPESTPPAAPALSRR